MSPRPVDEWPNEPLVESEIRPEHDPTEALDSIPIDETVFGVWGMTRERESSTAMNEPMPADTIVDLVLETPIEYHMYSYTHHKGTRQWVAYESEQKGTEGGDRLETTLERYALLAGESDLA